MGFTFTVTFDPTPVVNDGSSKNFPLLLLGIFFALAGAVLLVTAASSCFWTALNTRTSIVPVFCDVAPVATPEPSSSSASANLKRLY